METKKVAAVGVAVITHKSKKHLARCLQPLMKSPLQPRVVVVNSSSHDGTVEEAISWGAEVLLIPRHEFNHGSTREKARRYLNTDIVVMVTPDAYAKDEYVLNKLIEPILNNHAKASYARQVAHDGADFFETFARDFNYPVEGHLRGIEDAQKYGAYTFFCSNSFAAYSNQALDEVGGFPSVLLGEDTLVTAKLLKKGYKIAYAADAIVQHSHRYTLKQEFQRNFDTGLARHKCREMIKEGGSDSKRGLAYVREMWKRLFLTQPHLIPYSILQTAAKWLGYKTGSCSVNAPLWWKKACSSQDFYWSTKK